MSYRLAYHRLSGPLKGFIEFKGSTIRGGPLGWTSWTLVGEVEGEIPPSFTAEPAEYNFQKLDHLNGRFHAYVAGGTITLTYLEHPGATITGRASGNFEIRGKTHVIYFRDN